MTRDEKHIDMVVTQTESRVIGVGGDSRFGYPLEIALGVIELARAR